MGFFGILGSDLKLLSGIVLHKLTVFDNSKIYKSSQPTDLICYYQNSGYKMKKTKIIIKIVERVFFVVVNFFRNSKWEIL